MTMVHSDQVKASDVNVLDFDLRELKKNILSTLSEEQIREVLVASNYDLAECYDQIKFKTYIKPNEVAYYSCRWFNTTSQQHQTIDNMVVFFGSDGKIAIDF
jgi:aldehyde:ferredoxin oxidoreductase